MSTTTSSPAADAKPEFNDVHGKIGSEEFPAEAGRYHLYQHNVCPFAQRPLISHAIAGLDGVVSISVMDPLKSQEKKWRFTEEHPDPHHPEFRSIIELYELGAPGYTGAHSVPVLFDTKTQKIVSNSSAEIAENIVDAFGELAKYPGRSLSPAGQEEASKEILTWLNKEVVFAPYKILLAADQEAYDAASENFFGSVDSPTGLQHLDNILKERTFLSGDKFGLVDIFAYVVVYRLPIEFLPAFGASKATISDYPHLTEWFAAVRNIEGVRESQDYKVTIPFLSQWLTNVNPGAKFLPAVRHDPVLDLPAPKNRVPFA